MCPSVNNLLNLSIFISTINCIIFSHQLSFIDFVSAFVSAFVDDTSLVLEPVPTELEVTAGEVTDGSFDSSVFFVSFIDETVVSNGCVLAVAPACEPVYTPDVSVVLDFCI